MVNPMKKIITFGTFDVFHIGHINILERASQLGDYLIVGVSSDILNFNKKNRYPVYCQNDRVKIISSLKFVDEVFIEESLELKLEYIKRYEADVLVMGDDWEGKFDWVKSNCDVIYLPRTPSISTTEIIEIVRSR
jgi:glycerol-3-phosphate cytidylyltransferase